ncbi:hypothetical protein Hypma_010812 [Hypsizygus marmoreus]|uniref:NADP-dependent oxidoreductase domain-containing protein n=1 Tax=Hypsizygus marmoreus TaxID=39966 RepID=A0A369JRN3_HYPMA|nr:hypothetical protein Hypma_010812 [Hypsizygus marmoreus]
MPFGSVKLNDGNELPAIGFGTGTALRDKDAAPYIAQAIETGFSHIDTAQIYNNEESVGVAIRESALPRSDLYITTKYGYGPIQETVRTSLGKLGLKQLDLYLIHHPRNVGFEFERSWKEFEKIKEDGLSRSIGVSNFNLEQLQSLVKTATIIPAVNQIAFHPYNYAENKGLLEYAAKHRIVIEAYSSLTPITKFPGGAVDGPINAAAKRRGVAPTQVILAWVKAKGVVIVTTSSSKQHLEQYLAVADIPPLTKEEIAAIDEAGAKGPPRTASQKAGRAASLALALAVSIAITVGIHTSFQSPFQVRNLHLIRFI